MNLKTASEINGTPYATALLPLVVLSACQIRPPQEVIQLLGHHSQPICKHHYLAENSICDFFTDSNL